MKYFILFSLFFSSNWAASAQQYRVSFLKERNPVLKVSAFEGKRISVSGVIRQTYSYPYTRLLIIGKMGDPINPPKFSTNLAVVIKKADVSKFSSVKNDDLVDSYAFITGKVIWYHKKWALQLNNLKDLEFDGSKNPPVLK